MSDRLRAVFKSTRAEGRCAFAPYVTAGFPEPADTVEILMALETGGADIIEMGVPFSDPLADGATVEHANHLAVEAGVSYGDCLAYVREARASGLVAPIVLMGYYNPLLAHGLEQAVLDARLSGADGFIVVDLPPEEAGPFVAACRTQGLAFVPLVAPTTPTERIATIAALADAFIYCVSVTGTTGSRDELPDDLPAFIARVRGQTDLPLAVGFGIKTREHVKAVEAFADAIAIGSAIIATLEAAPGGERAARVRAYVEDVTGR